MKPVAVVAYGAVSALGEGEAACFVGEAGETATSAIQEDDALRAAGLQKPFLARVVSDGMHGDPAAALLERAARGLVASLERILPGFRARRVGVAVGTSSGGMVPLTEALGMRARGDPIPPALAVAAPYFGPLSVLPAVLGIEPVERTQVLAACASSAVAIGLGCRWLELGLVDLVIAGGYDAVSVFVAAGFESLGATTAAVPSPFRKGRSGMCLGEGAALLALVPPGDATGPALGFVRGFGASSDAVHVTAPDRTGAGLARAAHAALFDSGLPADAVDLVSAHATATPFNDAAESHALAAVLGDRASEVVVHPFKAVIGHTLGASSALELLAAYDALRRSMAPAAAGSGAIDPDASAFLLERNEPRALRACLKLSAAFGGANAALVATRHAGPEGDPRPGRPVSLVAVGAPRRAPDLDAVGSRTRIPPVQLARVDGLSAAAIAAVAAALEGAPPANPARVGVVVGSAAATLANDEAFHVRLRERGARFVEPRRFPPTSPNLPPGQCSIAFGFQGPSLAVGAGLDASLEALLVGHDLVAAGDCDVAVVVAVEQVDASVTELWQVAGWPVPEDGAAAVVLGAGSERPLDRSALSAARGRCRGGQGAVAGARPGWPSLLAAVASLDRASGESARAEPGRG